MENTNNVVTGQPVQPAEEQIPEWNKPKPIEDELSKYGSGKGLKVFLIIGLFVVLAAIGLFLYKTILKGQTPEEQVQRQPTTQKVEDKKSVNSQEKTDDKSIQTEMTDLESIDLNEADKFIEATDVDDLN